MATETAECRTTDCGRPVGETEQGEDPQRCQPCRAEAATLATRAADAAEDAAEWRAAYQQVTRALDRTAEAVEHVDAAACLVNSRAAHYVEYSGADVARELIEQAAGLLRTALLTVHAQHDTAAQRQMLATAARARVTQ